MAEPAHLRTGSLSFIEVLATSVALIGPSMTPILIAPYMYANAGNGAWLAYAFGGAMLVVVALNINQFARRSSAAGSMYGYVADHLGPFLGAIGGWTLLWAYGFVAAAVLGAMALFVGMLLADAGLRGVSGVAAYVTFALAVAAAAWQAAYRGVQISAIVMLVLEAISVAIICWLIVVVLVHHGPSVDAAQLTVRGGFPGGVGLAIATAVFSYVGFESATAFGGEAARPLVTIPRAVIGSVLFVSAFFIVAIYAEIVGMQHASTSLDKQTFPLGTLVALFDVGYLRVPLTIGALCSAFSVCLACITTAGRIAYAMALAGILPPWFASIEPKHATPHVAVTTVTAITAIVAVASLGAGVAPIDVFNNCGTLSSFGFIVIYALISVAAAIYVNRLGEMRSIDFLLAVAALGLLLVPAITLFYPVPPPPQRWFAYYFLAFLVAGCGWFAIGRRAAA
ncbi:MAG TPA: APC family permease [Candidatus Acidoferrales bacterium]|nr:APC family permease [Candidatus Acidoferrales bacterium]